MDAQSIQEHHALTVLPAYDIAMSSVKMRSNKWYCADGSRSSACLSNSGRSNWVSVQLPPAHHRIFYLAIYVYCPWGGMPLAPFGVWISPLTFGDTTSSQAFACAPRIEREPANGAPLYVRCGGISLHGGYVTVMQLGDSRGLYISEVVVYGPPAPPPPAPPPTLVSSAAPLTSAVDVNARFTNGGPARTVREGGVLVHMLDSFELADMPWRTSSQCTPFPVDHWACSLIHRNEPFLYPGGSTIGLVLAPHAPIMCMFTEDAGSGGKANGGCTHAFSGEDLLQTMRSQRHGKFNEAIVNGLWYERNLPTAIEAVIYTTTSYWEWVGVMGKAEERDKARQVHAAFLGAYGLSGREVPLLRFDGHRFDDDYAVVDA